MTDRLAAAISELVDAIRDELTQADSPAKAPPRLLSVDEAAEALGIGRTALYAAIASGQVHSVSIGRRRLVPASAIAELVAVRPAASARANQ